MERGQPSQTALGAAAYRAAHQVLEYGRIFHDPLALRILGDAAGDAVQHARDDPSSRGLRVYLAARSRFAEDRIAEAIARGVRQIVILGAGLDTYAYRAPAVLGLRVFEVDHPATQAWKREMLDRANIAVPDNVTFLPVDFEREAIDGALSQGGFEDDAPAFFVWLGVVPYLSVDAVRSTLATIGAQPGGPQVVFDYSDPPESLDAAARERHEALATRVANMGETMVTHFAPDQLRQMLTALGFARIEDLGPAAIAERYFAARGGARHSRGGHLVWAATN